MIYTISKNYITFEEDQKRTYPNGGKFKTNAEERHDEESYHNKSYTNKDCVLSSTLVVQDMSNVLFQRYTEECSSSDKNNDYIKKYFKTKKSKSSPKKAIKKLIEDVEAKVIPNKVKTDNIDELIKLIEEKLIYLRYK